MVDIAYTCVKYPTALAWSQTQGVWFFVLEFRGREYEDGFVEVTI